MVRVRLVSWHSFLTSKQRWFAPTPHSADTRRTRIRALTASFCIFEKGFLVTSSSTKGSIWRRARGSQGARVGPNATSHCDSFYVFPGSGEIRSCLADVSTKGHAHSTVSLPSTNSMSLLPRNPGMIRFPCNCQPTLWVSTMVTPIPRCGRSDFVHLRLGSKKSKPFSPSAGGVQGSGWPVRALVRHGAARPVPSSELGAGSCSEKICFQTRCRQTLELKWSQGMERIEQAASAFYGWGYPLLTLSVAGCEQVARLGLPL